MAVRVDLFSLNEVFVKQLRSVLSDDDDAHHCPIECAVVVVNAGLFEGVCEGRSIHQLV